MLPAPLSPYGASKLYGEALCSAYFHSYDLPTVSLRFANAYGPYSGHKTSVIATFIKRIKENKPLEIYGDGNQTRDFIHAEDVCQAIYLCLVGSRSAEAHSTGIFKGDIFQIATGEETRIIDLAHMVKDVYGNESVVIRFASERKGEIKRNYSDIQKARRLLGFRPKIELKEGIRFDQPVAGPVS
jgi:UDP-glucose 4-epimerase